MNILQIKNGNSVLEIDLSQGRILSFTGNGRALCEGNAYPLFVVGIIAENYEKSRISSFDCVLNKIEEKDGKYVFVYTYFEKFVITVMVAVDEKTGDFRFRIHVKNNHNILEFPEPSKSSCNDTPGYSTHSIKSFVLFFT